MTALPWTLPASALVVFGFDMFGDLDLPVGVAATTGVALASAGIRVLKTWVRDRSERHFGRGRDTQQDLKERL